VNCFGVAWIGCTTLLVLATIIQLLMAGAAPAAASPSWWLAFVLLGHGGWLLILGRLILCGREISWTDRPFRDYSI
jgi:hypothetical protein